MSKQVLIIGGGVIGLSTAYYAARKGHRVAVLDRGTIEQENCSYGNAGLVVPSHFVPLAAPGMVALGLKWMLRPDSPFYVKPRFDMDLLGWGIKFWRAANAGHVSRSAPLLRDLNLASRRCFEELAELTGNAFRLEKKGVLCLCKTERRLEEEARTAGQARQLGLNVEILSARQAMDLDPQVRLDIVGAVYFRDDCHLIPALFMAARELRLILPMQAGKGYNLTLPKPRQLPTIPAILTEARVAVTPMGSSLRFGGTMEIAGLNENINPVRVQGIIKSVPKYYPDFNAQDFDGIKPWCGLRPCSPDGLPYVGRTARFPNLSIATGHAMMGLSLAPITGKLMAEILSGEQPSIDIQLLDPDRYARLSATSRGAGGL